MAVTRPTSSLWSTRASERALANSRRRPIASAARSYGLLERAGIESEVTFAGGVARNPGIAGGAARNPGMIRALEDALDQPHNVSGENHHMGALGAALFV